MELPHHTFNPYEHSQDLKESALRGCHLCTVILHSFEDIFDRLSTAPGERERVMNRLLDRLQISLTTVNAFPRRYLVPGLIGPDSTAVDGEWISLRSSSSCLPTQLKNSPTSLSSTHVSTASQATAKLVKDWIAECTKFHSKCSRPNNSFLPTRLVDVQSLSKDGKIKVLETQSLSNKADIRYITLSYCWGLTPNFKLEKSTQHTLSSGVTIEVLPKTIQDTIRFMHNINLNWLWVDSLCIIQDSHEDWKREAMTMIEVYKNCFLSIAALGATNSHEGLYTIRDPLIYSPCYLFDNEEGESIYGRMPLGREPWSLHKRGWVLQERILPLRTLNFGPYVVWQCQEKVIGEYDFDRRESHKGFELSKRFLEVVLRDSTYDKSSTDRDQEILELWTEIAKSYTKGLLTVSTDRLIAISGIISAIHSRTGWVNLAGLWVPFLWKQLLWENLIHCRWLEPRKATGLQPSWSWIANTGAVYWDNDLSEQFPSHTHMVAHVQSIDETVLVKADSNSSSGAHIAINVSCMAAKLSKLSSVRGELGRYHAELADFPLSGKGEVVLDITVMTRQPELFLPIGATASTLENPAPCNIHLLVTGLAVSSSINCEGAFERVGFFTFSVTNEDAGGDSIDNNLAILNDLSRRKDYVIV
jgi:hypothetical protein